MDKQVMEKLNRVDVNKLVESLMSVADNIKNPDRILFGVFRNDKRVAYIVKSLIEMAVVYAIMMLLVTSPEKANGVLYFVFARQVYMYIEEFYLNY